MCYPGFMSDKLDPHNTQLWSSAYRSIGSVQFPHYCLLRPISSTKISTVASLVVSTGKIERHSYYVTL